MKTLFHKLSLEESKRIAPYLSVLREAQSNYASSSKLIEDIIALMGFEIVPGTVNITADGEIWGDNGMPEKEVALD